MSSLTRRFARRPPSRVEVTSYVQRQVNALDRHTLVRAVVIAAATAGVVGALVAFLVLRAGWLPNG